MLATLSKRIILLLIAPVLFLAFTSKTDHANLSGQWKLNEGKSDLGPFGQFATRIIKVDQKDDAISITQTRPSFNGEEMTTTEVMSYDGKEVETSMGGNSKRKAGAKWSDDGKSLIVSYVLNLDFGGGPFEVKGTETWSVSDDGKTLTMQANSSSSQGDLSTKAIYDKQ